MQRMLRWERYKGGVYVQIVEIMYTCMAEEYTLINCMALAENIPMQGPRMCVCIEKIAQAQQRFLRAFLS